MKAKITANLQLMPKLNFVKMYTHQVRKAVANTKAFKLCTKGLANMFVPTKQKY